MLPAAATTVRELMKFGYTRKCDYRQAGQPSLRRFSDCTPRGTCHQAFGPLSLKPDRPGERNARSALHRTRVSSTWPTKDTSRSCTCAISLAAAASVSSQGRQAPPRLADVSWGGVHAPLTRTKRAEADRLGVQLPRGCQHWEHVISCTSGQKGGGRSRSICAIAGLPSRASAHQEYCKDTS